MKLSTKIIIPFTLLLVILIGTFVYLLVYTSLSQKKIEAEIASAQKVNEMATELERIRFESQTSLLSYRFNNDPEYLDIIERNKERVNVILNDIKLYNHSHEGKELLENYANSRFALQESRINFIKAIQSGDDNSIRKYFGIWEIHADNSAAAILDFKSYNFQSVIRSDLLYKDLSSKIFYITVVLTILTILFVTLIIFYIRQIVTRPIEELSFAAQNIARGKFDTNLKVYSNDELGDLAANLNSMSIKLKSYYKNLQNEVRRKELEIKRNKVFETQKDDFMSIASHELKTPVTSLKVFEQLLMQQIVKNGHKEYEKYVQKIDLQINKLTNLISNLLDVTKIQAGKMPLEMGIFDLNTCIEDVVEISQQVSTHKIVVKGKADRQIYGDKERISQVIENLISNAIKYSPDAKEVVLNITNHKDFVSVSVHDFGIGINKSEQKKVFNRFYRVANVNESTFPGLGMGLYISYEIVKRHGGKFKVESKKGDGTTFTFTLPTKVIESSK